MVRVSPTKTGVILHCVSTYRSDHSDSVVVASVIGFAHEAAIFFCFTSSSIGRSGHTCNGGVVTIIFSCAPNTSKLPSIMPVLLLLSSATTFFARAFCGIA